MFKNNKSINIGIIGCGVIGGVMKQWLENHNSNCNILCYDPPKNMYDDLTMADIIFISIHIPTEDNHTQDLSLLKELILKCPNVPIYIRTTLLPGTCDALTKELNKEVHFMPEFLTERTAYEDFCKQPMIYTCNEDLMKFIFIGKKYMTATNLEAEIIKYSHNVFGAVKVTYFNGIYELAQKMNCDFETIRKGTLLSGYINEPHTMVPGPDGKIGYGGKCFPKDVAAFSKYMEQTNISSMLKEVEKANKKYRETSS